MRTVERAGVADQAASAFLKACKEAVRAVLPRATVVLFGSRARGDARPDSDYDLLVLAANEADAVIKQRVRDAVYDVALDHGAVASVFLYSRRRWNSPLWRNTPLHARVEEEGALL